MRRETFEKGSEDYVEWLKSLGCIMYTPLREDLQDRISGNSFVPTGDGAYAFVNGYCEVTTPSTSPASPLNITIPALATNTSKDYTVLCEAQLIQKSVANNSCRLLLFGNQAVNSEFAPQYYANPYPTALAYFPSSYGNLGWVTDVTKIVRVYSYDNKTFTYYKDGAFLFVDNGYTVNITSMSSPYNQGFTLGCAGHNNFRNCKFRVRDIMFFTAALDLATIKQIQGL